MHKVQALTDSKLLSAITPREEQLLILASEGHCDASIAKALGISRGTVLSLWARLRAKLGQQTRVPAIAGMISAVSRLVEQYESALGESLDSPDVGFVLTSRHGIVLAGNAFSLGAMGCRLGHLLEDALDPGSWPDAGHFCKGRDRESLLVWPVSLRNDLRSKKWQYSAFVLLLEDPFIGKTMAIRFRLEPASCLASSRPASLSTPGHSRLPEILQQST
ncbi:MAG: hypothetical protein HONBIEJF_00301 [Fimbriimonadaceae bacterium]|nr:hypothetical protein [Fimbriimonadaceae bacterium]